MDATNNSGGDKKTMYSDYKSTDNDLNVGKTGQNLNHAVDAHLLAEKLMVDQKNPSGDDGDTKNVPNDIVHPNEMNKIADPDRETWGKKVDFLLSVIGFAVDLANVWRFPYLCYKNGGGAFLIPYVLMLVLGGIPLFYMELALGQFNRKGAITCWSRICPLFKGVGYSVVLIAFYTDFFYNVIISWALYYFFASFTSNLPWTSCNNTWNTVDCFDGHLHGGIDSLGSDEQTQGSTVIYNASYNAMDVTIALNSSLNDTSGSGSGSSSSSSLKNNRTSPAQEYFERGVMNLNLADGVENIGHIRWQLALCLLAVYLICYFSLWKGISTSGKVVWFTALFPYVVLFILLIRGVTLPGAAKGIKYYLTPHFEELLSSTVWVDAATQVFFSLGPGFGVLLAYASYNKFHNNVYLDALATSSINCLTSFLSGFVIFSVLGYMAQKTGKEIKDVATEGPGLVFMVYPEAIATLPASTFWALIFFMMLLTLGLDSSFGGSEAIITALSDEFKWVKKHREIFVALLFSFYFLVGLASCTQGGAYIVSLMDKYAAGYSILFAVFFETLAVSWLYGVERFSSDIEAMVGYRPGIYWKLCWKFIAPLFILSIMIFGFVMYEPLRYDERYTYPWWANLIGWAMAMSSMLCMPVLAVYQIIITPGTFQQRITKLTTPWRDTHGKRVMNCDTKSNGNHPLDDV